MSLILAAAAIAFAQTPADAFLEREHARLAYADFELVSRAVRTLEANSNGKSSENCYTKFDLPWKPLRGIMPSPANFVGVWNWDSAFHAIGVSRYDGAYARDQLRLFLDFLQLENGMYADCLREGEDGIARLAIGGKPAPGFRLVTDCSKPPVFGWAAWRVLREHPDKALEAEIYASLERNAAWWKAKRFDASAGLYHYDGNHTDPKDRKTAAGWESGMDDSPRWDGDAWNFYAVDLNCYLAMTFRALASFAADLGKADAAAKWTAEADALAEAVRTRLWDAEDGCFYDWNFRAGRFSRILTPVSFIPLFAGVATDAQAAAMARQAARLRPGWPSVSYDDPQYDPKGYWRGRTWLNVAYMALKGLKFHGYGALADEGRREILGWVANDPGTIYETYDSSTGLPCGASHFGWSSAFILAFELDWELSRAEELPCGETPAAPVLAVAGQVTDKTPGWRFIPSDAKDGAYFNPLEGYYPDKGGKLVSPKIPLPSTPGGAYYRLTFSAAAPARSYESVNFYGAEGKFMADNYDVVYPGARRAYDRVFFAQSNVAAIEVFFQSEKGCEAWDVKVTPCTWREAAVFCDRLAAAQPAVPPPAARPALEKLPRLRAALEGRAPARVLLLGDSIVQDTFHSQFHALMRRAFPEAKVDWLVSVRGGTGCWYYRNPEHFASYVDAYKPDVVLVGGISNWNRQNPEVRGAPDFEEVAGLCAARGYEVAVMSPALSYDRRVPGDTPLFAPVAAKTPSPGELTYFAEEFGPAQFKALAEVCARRGWVFMDMTTPCYTWLWESALPFQWYSRDYCHSGERGKQVIARALVGALAGREAAEICPDKKGNEVSR